MVRNLLEELQKTNQIELKIEKVIKKKADKLFVQWKGYDNSFISQIDKIYRDMFRYIM